MVANSIDWQIKEVETRSSGNTIALALFILQTLQLKPWLLRITLNALQGGTSVFKAIASPDHK